MWFRLVALAYLVYYTWSYARYIWVKENNMLGAFAVFALGALIIAVPAYIHWFG